MSKLVWKKSTSLKVGEAKFITCVKGKAVPESVLAGWGEKGVESAIKNKIVVDVASIADAEQLKAEEDLRILRAAEAANSKSKKGGKK